MAETEKVAPTDFHPDEEIEAVLMSHRGVVDIVKGSFISASTGDGKYVRFRQFRTILPGDRQTMEVIARRSAVLATYVRDELKP